MKKILFSMIAAVGMLSSCSTSLMSYYTDDANPYNERVYYNYYTDDYYYNNQPVVYVDRVFYVQHWDSYSGRWYRQVLPQAYWGFVTPARTHNRYLGGRWARREPRRRNPYGAPSGWNYYNYQHNSYNPHIGSRPSGHAGGWRVGQQPRQQGNVHRNNQGNNGQRGVGNVNTGIRGTQNHGTPTRGTFGGSRNGNSVNRNITATPQERPANTVTRRVTSTEQNNTPQTRERQPGELQRRNMDTRDAHTTPRQNGNFGGSRRQQSTTTTRRPQAQPQTTTSPVRQTRVTTQQNQNTTTNAAPQRMTNTTTRSVRQGNQQNNTQQNHGFGSPAGSRRNSR